MADWLAIVLSIDPEIAPSSCGLSFSTILLSSCRQYHLLRGLGEIMPRIIGTQTSVQALDPEVAHDPVPVPLGYGLGASEGEPAELSPTIDSKMALVSGHQFLSASVCKQS